MDRLSLIDAEDLEFRMTVYVDLTTKTIRNIPKKSEEMLFYRNNKFPESFSENPK